MLLAALLLAGLCAAPDARAASTGTAVSAPAVSASTAAPSAKGGTSRSEDGAPLGSAVAVQTSTGTAPAGAPATEYQTLKERVRQDQNAIRRARYALGRARQRADAGAAAQAEKRLQEAKESLKRHRTRMRELLGPKPPHPKVPEKPRG